MRRRLALVVAFATLVGGLAACGSGDAEAETPGTPAAERFVVYSARDKKVTDFVVEQFVAKHPEYNGKVEVLNMGAQEVLERTRAEKANPQGSVWWGGTQQGLSAGATEDLLIAHATGTH